MWLASVGRGRSQRSAEAGYVCHVLNWANARMTTFSQDGDNEASEGFLVEAVERSETLPVADCLRNMQAARR